MNIHILSLRKLRIREINWPTKTMQRITGRARYGFHSPCSSHHFCCPKVHQEIRREQDHCGLWSLESANECGGSASSDFYTVKLQVVLTNGLQHALSPLSILLLKHLIPPTPPAIMISRWYQPLHLTLSCHFDFIQEFLYLECSWRLSPRGVRQLKERCWSLSAPWLKAQGKYSPGTERT